MKKILLLFITLLLVGCTMQTIEVKPLDIEGYWQQIRNEYLGKVDDMSNDPYAYLEITDNKLYFYNESSNEKGYYEGVSEKNYILDDNKLYYDYYELNDDYKNNISEFGGIYEVSFENEYLILKKEYDIAGQKGYETNTYKKMEDGFRLKSYGDEK